MKRMKRTELNLFATKAVGLYRRQLRCLCRIDFGIPILTAHSRYSFSPALWVDRAYNVEHRIYSVLKEFSDKLRIEDEKNWMPAYAGMTGWYHNHLKELDASLRWHDGGFSQVLSMFLDL